MTKIDDGGPAFQAFRQHALGSVHELHPGMSLRDYFAASALQAYMSWSLNEPQHDGDSKESAAARYSRTAYFVADAMIAARKAGA